MKQTFGQRWIKSCRHNCRFHIPAQNCTEWRRHKNERTIFGRPVCKESLALIIYVAIGYSLFALSLSTTNPLFLEEIRRDWKQVYSKEPPSHKRVLMICGSLRANSNKFSWLGYPKTVKRRSVSVYSSGRHARASILRGHETRYCARLLLALRLGRIRWQK